MKIPAELKELAQIFEKNNKELFIVGGYVRDYLLGINSTDVDIATNAKPSDLIKIFPNGKTDSNYGSLKFSTNHFNYDITTLREEIYTKEKLEINLDDCYGHPTSFLEESFLFSSCPFSRLNLLLCSSAIFLGMINAFILLMNK